MKKHIIQGIVVFMFVAITSCKEEAKQSKTTSNEKLKNSGKTFSADSAYRFIQEQVSFGPRVPGTKAHASCVRYLRNKLESYGATVLVQEGTQKTFDGKSFTIQNIIASFNQAQGQRIMLCAHYDTRPFADQDTDVAKQQKPIDGANDGGSGVAVLLELARQISMAKPTIGVDIILFDLEDYGQPDQSAFPTMQDSYCLGSQFWAKSVMSQNYKPRFGVLLDMVGGSNAVFTQEEISRVYAPQVLSKIWNLASTVGYSSYFSFEASPAIIDDHYYINSIRSIPTADIIHRDGSTASGFWKHWHTQEDRMENIDKNSLQAVGQVLTELIYLEQ